MKDKEYVIVDTDIGTNIDDGLALAYLLAHPRCELLGVTTVGPRAMLRARLADALCQAAGQAHVPVHSGASNPSVIDPQADMPVIFQPILIHWPHREMIQPKRALNFLQETIREHPGQVNLLAIGPLTNIGQLFSLDPEIPHLLKRLVVMGGVYWDAVEGYGLLESNMQADPHAASEVFRLGGNRITAIGLDVTARCRIPTEQGWRHFRQGPLAIVGEMAEIWQRYRQEIIFHDPLAAACLFEPEFCDYRQGKVSIETLNYPERGRTCFMPDHPAIHSVGLRVRVNEFFRHYFQIIDAYTEAQAS